MLPGRAVIVAGGAGTRIRSISGDLIPKALVPVAGRPIVAWQLELLARHGVSEVGVCAGHLADALREGMAPLAEESGVHLTFFVEGEPLGTAGGLLAARAFVGEEDFFVLYGDVAVAMDLHRLEDFHRERGGLATVVCHPNDHPHESDLLRVAQDGRLLAVLPRAGRPAGFHANLVPAAVYRLSPPALGFIEPGLKQDFVRDVFPRMVREGAPVFAYNTPEYLRDMGTPERYAVVERDLEQGLPSRMEWTVRRPAVFFDRDGVLNREVGGQGLTRHEELELLPGAAEAVRLVNRRGWLAVVTTNQPQLAKGFITGEQLETVHAKLETLLGLEGAKLDRILHCPHHPERGFPGEVAELKVECECRKPAPGLLLRAARELPLDLAGSCLIGDSWRDAGAAKAAGVWAYGVRAGVGTRGGGGEARFELVFSDVLEATRFALDGLPEAHRIADGIRLALVDRRAPYVVGICGLARSGKSTLAHGLVRALRRHGLGALHVRLDDWIMPLSQRPAVSTTEERCRVSLYPGILDALLTGDGVEVRAYDPATREEGGAVAYRHADEPVIILEGVMACHGPLRRELDLALMVTADEESLADRFLEFYRWKGVDEGAARRLLEERRREEWPSVLAQGTLVDEGVRLTDLAGR